MHNEAIKPSMHDFCTCSSATNRLPSNPDGNTPEGVGHD